VSINRRNVVTGAAVALALPGIARAQNHGSAGNGSAGHLAMECLTRG
jgi:hypothetical protein